MSLREKIESTVGRLSGEREAFPDSSDRPGQYRTTVRLIATALERYGHPIKAEHQQTWIEMFERLPVLDTMIEENPDAFESPIAAVRFLNLEETTENVAVVQAGLDANRISLSAESLEEYFEGRRLEAITTAELLRLNSGDIADEHALWDQLKELAVAGIYFDTALDASEDAEQLPFTSRELATGAMRRIPDHIRSADRRLLISLLQGCIEFGVARYLFSRKRSAGISKQVMREILQIK